MTTPHDSTADHAGDTLRWLGVARDAAQRAGNALKQAGRAWTDVTAESLRDIKLRADFEAERIIVGCLSSGSPYPIFSEEAGSVSREKPQTGATSWLVDPLDGTFNYSRGLPSCCCSIALVTAGNPVLGAVYDFNRDEMFCGAVGYGATLNGRDIAVSTVAAQSDAVIMTGLPVNRDFSDLSLASTARQWNRWRKVRLIGSAALSLAYVACGRADAYHEENIMPWDVAAGLALVKAAGGHIGLPIGALDQPANVWATNGKFTFDPNQPAA